MDFGDLIGFFAGVLFASLFWLAWMQLEDDDRERTTSVAR